MLTKKEAVSGIMAGYIEQKPQEHASIATHEDQVLTSGYGGE